MAGVNIEIKSSDGEKLLRYMSPRQFATTRDGALVMIVGDGNDISTGYAVIHHDSPDELNCKGRLVLFSEAGANMVRGIPTKDVQIIVIR